MSIDVGGQLKKNAAAFMASRTAAAGQTLGSPWRALISGVAFLNRTQDETQADSTVTRIRQRPDSIRTAIASRRCCVSTVVHTLSDVSPRTQWRADSLSGSHCPAGSGFILIVRENQNRLFTQLALDCIRGSPMSRPLSSEASTCS